MDTITKIIEFVGALGVIASIVYLAKQVSLSTKVASAELTKDLYLASREAIMNIAADENLGKIWADIGNFESEDAARKWTFYQSFFRLYELEYNLSIKGLLDESIAKSYTLVIKMFGSTKDCSEYWKRARTTYDDQFVEFVDNILENNL